ncbi:uncharacterized protein LOC101863417 [Aplysia californica]|uniref:Uncharacterized protein LOC101863417 n=1 Tax=Aplysia californica TaxID=6500 RepID=A0ABM0JH24_APLCA|nr:uncharacterized protein LOC101863417 [Aplysia californica]
MSVATAMLIVSALLHSFCLTQPNLVYTLNFMAELPVASTEIESSGSCDEDINVSERLPYVDQPATYFGLWKVCTTILHSRNGRRRVKCHRFSDNYAADDTGKNNSMSQLFSTKDSEILYCCQLIYIASLVFTLQTLVFSSHLDKELKRVSCLFTTLRFRYTVVIGCAVSGVTMLSGQIMFLSLKLSDIVQDQSSALALSLLSPARSVLNNSYVRNYLLGSVSDRCYVMGHFFWVDVFATCLIFISGLYTWYTKTDTETVS